MNGGPTNQLVFFGQAWPEVERYRQVATPVGMKCSACGLAIGLGEQGIFRVVESHDHLGTITDHIPEHRTCPQPKSED